MITFACSFVMLLQLGKLWYFKVLLNEEMKTGKCQSKN
jgi:hypothetical protein